MVRHSDLAIKKRHRLTVSYILSALTVGSGNGFLLTIVAANIQ